MIDLLVPRTDAGVAVQVVVAVVVIIVSNVAVRRRPREIRLFVAGASILTIALLGLRAVH